MVDVFPLVPGVGRGEDVELDLIELVVRLSLEAAVQRPLVVGLPPTRQYRFALVLLEPRISASSVPASDLGTIDACSVQSPTDRVRIAFELEVTRDSSPTTLFSDFTSGNILSSDARQSGALARKSGEILEEGTGRPCSVASLGLKKRTLAMGS